MPPMASGETLLHTSSRSQPSSCIRSNLRSALENTLDPAGSGMPSKSRKGWNVIVVNPRSATMPRTSAGVPLKDRRSFSKISTPLNPAAAIASSFSFSVPLSDTVAIAVCMSVHSLGAVGSVPDPGYCAEVIGCRARKAKKLEIGGDLLEQHVGADLDRASEGARGLQERCELVL